MGIRKIVVDDDELLHKKSKAVERFDEKLSFFLDDMLETLHSTENAVGLAAPQVGILRRVAVINVGDGDVELVNPQIVEKKGEQFMVEGCLSYPGKLGKVKRPSYVEVLAYNRKGEKIVVEGKGLLACALCHEIDHLDGIVFLDKVEELVEE